MGWKYWAMRVKVWDGLHRGPGWFEGTWEGERGLMGPDVFGCIIMSITLIRGASALRVGCKRGYGLVLLDLRGCGVSAVYPGLTYFTCWEVNGPNKARSAGGLTLASLISSIESKSISSSL